MLPPVRTTIRSAPRGATGASRPALSEAATEQALRAVTIMEGIHRQDSERRRTAWNDRLSARGRGARGTATVPPPEPPVPQAQVPLLALDDVRSLLEHASESVRLNALQRLAQVLDDTLVHGGDPARPIDHAAWAAERAADPNGRRALDWEVSRWQPESAWASLMPGLAQLWPEVVETYQREAEAEGVDLTPPLIGLLTDRGYSAFPTWPVTRPQPTALHRVREILERGADDRLGQRLTREGPRSKVRVFRVTVLAHLIREASPVEVVAQLARVSTDDLELLLATPRLDRTFLSVLQEWVALLVTQGTEQERVRVLGRALAAHGAAFDGTWPTRIELLVASRTSGSARSRLLRSLAAVPGFVEMPAVEARLRDSQAPDVIREWARTARGPVLRDLLLRLADPRTAIVPLDTVLGELRPEQLQGLTRADAAPLLACQASRALRLWATRTVASFSAGEATPVVPARARRA